ncbi:protein NO VEIN domain-containing protein [Galactobacter caseinivorans]|uniref:DUF3883 domain-containing protein n=1 Tax=Galactobacter caseinivorans TaxID=2676123 RepID=A0A496PJT4_9MICC|nr:DUF3883 domain-containing protein [Galactobacter caseinivorans]RKW70727.1 DUF3883 domain-containing protein [Galactobacter caseinivorans]
MSKTSPLANRQIWVEKRDSPTLVGRLLAYIPDGKRISFRETAKLVRRGDIILLWANGKNPEGKSSFIGWSVAVGDPVSAEPAEEQDGGYEVTVELSAPELFPRGFDLAYLRNHGRALRTEMDRLLDSPATPSNIFLQREAPDTVGPGQGYLGAFPPSLLAQVPELEKYLEERLERYTGDASGDRGGSEPATDAEGANRGSGRQSDARLRQAVELHAMRRAELFLRSKYGEEPIPSPQPDDPTDGFVLDDTSQGNPYDFLVTLRGHAGTIHVEVKGTTSPDPRKILLTRNEVRLNQRSDVHHMLVVVDGIQISNHGQPYGGRLRFADQWRIGVDPYPSGTVLDPVQYEYVLNDSDLADEESF